MRKDVRRNRECENMSESKVIQTWGYFPDQLEDEEVFKFPSYYDAGDKGKVKAMLEMEGKFPDGSKSIFYLLYADKNGDGVYTKIQCNATVNRKIRSRVMTDSEFKVPFEFTVVAGTSDYGEYTAMKMLG